MIESANATTPLDSSVSLIAVKLPKFWSAQPKVWFAQAEAQLALRNVTSDETKYYHLVSSLDQDSAKRVVDLIHDPPKTNKYLSLKNRLMSTFTLSGYRMAQLLLSMAPLGDRSPSQLMDDMLALLGDHEPCILFRTVFVDLLPTEVRPHLVPILEVTAPRELAILADHLITTNSSISVIRKKTSFNAEANSAQDGWCRFHRKWGLKAFRCEAPCTFRPSSKSSVNAVLGNFEDGRQ